MPFTANGTAATYNAVAVANIEDVSASQNGNEIDVTVLADTTHKYEAGIPDLEISLTLRGTSTIDVGDQTGDLVITWADSATTTIADALCTGKEEGASIDGALQTVLTFKPGA